MRSRLKDFAGMIAIGALVASLVFVGLRMQQQATTPSLPDPLLAGWNGAPVCESLLDEPRQRIMRCEFPPGSGHERHFHAPHFGYAIAGGKVRMTDSQGVRELELATGSSYSSDGVAWHEVLNIGNTTVTYLIVEPK